MTGSRSQKLASESFGRVAEATALVLLTAKGYRVLDRRYRASGGEIDLVAQRGRTVVFVEVKARPMLDAAATAITTVKQHRLRRAAAHWLAAHRWAASCTRRGDAIFVAPWRLPRHVADAFPLDG